MPGPVGKLVRSMTSRKLPKSQGPASSDEEDDPPPPPSPGVDEALPPGWREVQDARSGRTYYVGPSGATTWTRPAAGAQTPLPPGLGAAAAKTEPTHQAVEPTGRIEATGKTEFPNSRRPASRWLRLAPIPNNPASEGVVDFEQVEGGLLRVQSTTASAAQLRDAESALETRETSMRRVVSHGLKKWSLPPPSVLISVTGGAVTLDITPKQATVFKNGLLGSTAASWCGPAATCRRSLALRRG